MSTLKTFFSTVSDIWKSLPTKVKVILILVVLGLTIYDNLSEDKKTEKPKIYNFVDTDPLEIEIALFNRSIDDVKNELKDATTAKFSDREESQILIQKSDSTVHIVSKVTSKNSFGVMLTSNYYAEYKYISGDPGDRYSYNKIGIVIK